MPVPPIELSSRLTTTNRMANMRRVALLGPTGYVGSAFAAEIKRRQHTLLPISRSDCDIYNDIVLTKRLLDLAPDFLINCAGYTGKPNVDACETQKTECLAGNAVLPGIVAKACERAALAWGHVSSGCIYTGSRSDGSGFSEVDPPNFTFRQGNCSFYSGTKALGEEILTDVQQCYVWRLRIPFSNIDSSRNYLSKLIRYSRLLDARNSLSYLPEFVAACLDCLERNLPYGVYHLTNPDAVTTREVVDLICDSGVCQKQFHFFDSEADFMRSAIAPRSNCVLDSSKAIKANLKLSPVRDAIWAALNNWQREQQPDSPLVDVSIDSTALA